MDVFSIASIYAQRARAGCFAVVWPVPHSLSFDCKNHGPRHSNPFGGLCIMTTRSGTNSALLVVDVQVGVVAQAWNRDRIVGNVSLAVRRARESGVPVVWVQHHDEELIRETPGWQLVPELEALPGELRVHKNFNSAFEDTELLFELDRLGVSRIFLAGAATNWCIRATAYGALDRGFDVTLISDAHTTQDMELEPGSVVEARSVIDDLNVTMRWLTYPGRSNAAVPAAEAAFV